MRRALISIALLALAGGGLASSEEKGSQAKAAAPDATAAARGMIEPMYRKSNGIGFKSFACPGGRPAGGFLDCDAVDEEGDALRYTLKVDENGDAEVVLVTQSASGLLAEGRAALEAPCRSFLDAYAAGDWERVYSTFHPELRRKVTREQAKALLEPVRSSLGRLDSAELRSYSLRVPDQHELQYALACASGRGAARFRIHLAEKGATISAFTVAAEPGSALQAAMLEPTLRAMLSNLIGRPVERLEARLERLAGIGDAVPATAYLSGGRQVPVRVVQTGRPDDFDPIDFTAELLDAPLLIERYLAGRGGPAVKSVDCPSPVVADGGEETCRVSLAGGALRAVTIARRGGEHRVVEDKPVER